MILDQQGLEALIADRNHGDNTLFIFCEQPHRSLRILDVSVIVAEGSLSAQALFNSLQELYNRFDQWDLRLKQIYYENGSFQDLIDSCEPILAEPIMLVDKKFRYAAFSRSVEALVSSEFMNDNRYSLPEAVNDFISDYSFQTLYDVPDIFDYAMVTPTGADEMICKNVFDPDGYAGRFVILLFKDSTSADKTYIRSILAYFFIYADRLFQKYQSFDLKEVVLNSLREPLMQMLQNDQPPHDSWYKAAFENDWQKTDHLQLIQFRSNTRYSKNIYGDYLSSEIENQWQGCVCLNFKERLLMLINLDRSKGKDDEPFYRQLPLFLRESLLIAGQSRIFTDIADLKAAYEQTEVALDLGLRDHPMFWTYRFDDYAFSYLLKNSVGGFLTHQICSEKLLALRRYDAEKSTDYYKTLLTYLNCRLNAAAAAKDLFIHRSSFLSRLDRMKELFHINFDSNDELLYLGLSLLIIERN